MVLSDYKKIMQGHLQICPPKSSRAAENSVEVSYLDSDENYLTELPDRLNI